MVFPRVVACACCDGRGFIVAQEEKMDQAITPLQTQENLPCCMCDTCGRKSASINQIGQFCATPGADGKPCTGAMKPLQHRSTRPPLMGQVKP